MAPRGQGINHKFSPGGSFRGTAEAMKGSRAGAQHRPAPLAGARRRAIPCRPAPALTRGGMRRRGPDPAPSLNQQEPGLPHEMDTPSEWRLSEPQPGGQQTGSPAGRVGTWRSCVQVPRGPPAPRPSPSSGPGERRGQEVGRRKGLGRGHKSNQEPVECNSRSIAAPNKCNRF